MSKITWLIWYAISSRQIRLKLSLNSTRWALYQGEISVGVLLKGALYRGLAVIQQKDVWLISWFFLFLGKASWAQKILNTRFEMDLIDLGQRLKSFTGRNWTFINMISNPRFWSCSYNKLSQKTQLLFFLFPSSQIFESHKKCSSFLFFCFSFILCAQYCY